jgi:hypothetical protein
MKIPFEPKDYYKDTFKSLDDLLDKELNKEIIFHFDNKKAQYGTNADRNIKLIANDDDKKIKYALKWLDFNKQIILEETKKYIDTLFNINCTLKPQIKFTPLKI